MDANAAVSELLAVQLVAELTLGATEADQSHHATAFMYFVRHLFCAGHAIAKCFGNETAAYDGHENLLLMKL